MVDQVPETAEPAAESADDPSSDFPTRIADFLEAIVTRIRSLTVDRVARIITFITLGFVALTLVGIAVFYLLVGLLRIAGELTRKICDCGAYMEIAYAVVGGLFLLLGAFLWARRTRGAEST